MDGLSEDGQARFDLSEDGARALGSLTHLTHLNIGAAHLNGEGLEILSSSLSGLTYLNLNCSSSVDDNSVKGLTSLTSLIVLHLADIDVGDEGVKALAHTLTNLTELHLRYTCIGDEGVEALAFLPALSFLDLYDDICDEYGNAMCRVGDAGVRALAACPALDRVELSPCSIRQLDDESRAVLERCRFTDTATSNISDRYRSQYG
jgi:hypothetical protein